MRKYKQFWKTWEIPLCGIMVLITLSQIQAGNFHRPPHDLPKPPMIFAWGPQRVHMSNAYWDVSPATDTVFGRGFAFVPPDAPRKYKHPPVLPRGPYDDMDNWNLGRTIRNITTGQDLLPEMADEYGIHPDEQRLTAGCGRTNLSSVQGVLTSPILRI